MEQFLAGIVAMVTAFLFMRTGAFAFNRTPLFRNRQVENQVQILRLPRQNLQGHRREFGLEVEARDRITPRQKRIAREFLPTL